MDPYMAYETPGSQTAQRGSKGHAQRSSKRSIFSCLICISRPAVDDDIHAGNTHKWMQSPDAAGGKANDPFLAPSFADALKPSNEAISAEYARQQVVCQMDTPTSSEAAPSTPSAGSAASRGEAPPSARSSDSGDLCCHQPDDASICGTEYEDCLSRSSVMSWCSSAEQDGGELADTQQQQDQQLVCFSAARAGSGDSLTPTVTVGIAHEPKAVLPPWVPDSPLLFNNVPNTRFVPVPESLPFHGYWARDQRRTTPSPQPGDTLLGAGRFCNSVKSTIQGIKMTDTPTSIKIQLRCWVFGMPFTYTEVFDKDSSMAHWNLRRDVRVGHSKGRLYFTEDGRIVTRVWCTTGGPEAYYEDYSHMEEGGTSTVITQHCKCLKTGRTAVQHLVGNKSELPSKK